MGKPKRAEYMSKAQRLKRRIWSNWTTEMWFKAKAIKREVSKMKSGIADYQKMIIRRPYW